MTAGHAELMPVADRQLIEDAAEMFAKMAHIVYRCAESVSPVRLNMDEKEFTAFAREHFGDLIPKEVWAEIERK